MDKTEFDDLIDEERFTPFIITTKNNFILAIGPEERRHTLAGASTLVVMDAEGHFIHIPYHAIDRINQLQ
jgi:hypothetical protein